MLMVGASTTFVPLPHCSAPSTCPYCRINPVSQVAAPATGAANWVTPVNPSPAPTGPSCRCSGGMPSRVLPSTHPT